MVGAEFTEMLQYFAEFGCTSSRARLHPLRPFFLALIRRAFPHRLWRKGYRPESGGLDDQGADVAGLCQVGRLEQGFERLEAVLAVEEWALMGKSRLEFAPSRNLAFQSVW